MAIKIDIQKLLEEGSKIKVNNIQFDEIKLSNLILNAYSEENLIQNLQKQAAGIAYYGSILKQVRREIKKIEKEKNDFYMEKFQASNVALAKLGNGKSTKAETDSMTYLNYKKAFDKFDKQIDELTQYADTIESYYQGWKQKGYILNNLVTLVNSGFIKTK